MPKTRTAPPRSAVARQDTWDLTVVFKNDAAWEKAYGQLEAMIPVFEKFRGKLGKSAKNIRDCYDAEAKFSRLAEQLGQYAQLKSCEDVANSTYQAMVARYAYVATRAGEAASFIAPEIRTIPVKTMDKFLVDKALVPYKFALEKLLRYRKHILSEKEERLLAMQGEVSDSAQKIFGQLNDADLKFGEVTDERGRKTELTQSSFRSLMESPARKVRKEAFHKFYKAYADHENTLAASLSSSVLQDVYQSRVRNYPSAVEGALFGDKIPMAVYDNLVAAVRKNLDTVYYYFDVRKRALKLREIHAYDTYAPLVESSRVKNPYDKAVETLCAALQPLGDTYVSTMRKGLSNGRWVDRYENQGKRSGAFSYGIYDSPPFILMNYRSDVIDSMFTLAHEAGHSMHSWHSNKAQPYQYAHYTIFVAEVASTFNEQLVGHYLMERATTKKQRIQLICKEIDEIRGTIVRQTMFAEFEKTIHALAEAGEPLTLEAFRAEYRKLLDAYFGPGFTLDPELELECFRIPHFYNAFYVYKYATGLSAAIALSRAVLYGNDKDRERYLKFLKGGGSKFPLDLLRDAGVDLEEPYAVSAAMTRFRELVEELDELL